MTFLARTLKEWSSARRREKVCRKKRLSFPLAANSGGRGHRAAQIQQIKRIRPDRLSSKALWICERYMYGVTREQHSDIRRWVFPRVLAASVEAYLKTSDRKSRPT